MIHQNNIGQHRDDYDYEFANHRLSEEPGIVTTEVGDMEEARMNEAMMSSLSIAESMEDTDFSKIIPLGKQRRKLLFTREKPIVSGYSDEGGAEPDYDDNKHRTVGGSALWMKGRQDSHRNTIDDELGGTGADGNDYYQQFGGGEGSYGDISGHALPIVETSNRAHYERNRRAYDGRNEDNTVSRKRKSAKTEEGVLSDPTGSNSVDTTTKATVYHQHYDDSYDSQRVDGTDCNCTLICAKEKASTNKQSDAYEKSTTTGDKPAKDKTEEQTGEEEIEKEDDNKEEETEYMDGDAEGNNSEDEYIPEEEYVEEMQTSGGGETGQRELYIDLTIGIRNLGNASLSEDQEPMEFHKKIIVKREKPSNTT